MLDLTKICGSGHYTGAKCEHWDESLLSCEIIALISINNISPEYNGKEIFHKFIRERCNISCIIIEFVFSRLENSNFSKKTQNTIATLFYEETIDYLENTFVKKNFVFSDKISRNILDLIKLISGAWKGSKTRIIKNAFADKESFYSSSKEIPLEDSVEKLIHNSLHSEHDHSLEEEGYCEAVTMIDLLLAEMWLSVKRADAIRRIIAVKKYSSYLLEQDIGKDDFSKRMGIDPAVLRRGLSELQSLGSPPKDPKLECIISPFQKKEIEEILPELWKRAVSDNEIRQAIFAKKYFQALSTTPSISQREFASFMNISPLPIRKAIQLLQNIINKRDTFTQAREAQGSEPIHPLQKVSRQR